MSATVTQNPSPPGRSKAFRALPRPTPNPWLVLVIACLAQFMVVLDASVVNIALPSVQRGLHFSAANLQWVVNGYTLIFGGFLLLGGRAADLLGRKRLFVAELGNGSVEAIDLASGRSLGRVTGLSEPQGVGYLPRQDELAVATGGDGMLRFYRAGFGAAEIFDRVLFGDRERTRGMCLRRHRAYVVPHGVPRWPRRTSLKTARANGGSSIVCISIHQRYGQQGKDV